MDRCLGTLSPLIFIKRVRAGAGGVPVEGDHAGDRLLADLAGALVPVVEDPYAQGFGEADRQARLGGVVAHEPLGVGGAGDRHPVDRLGGVDQGFDELVLRHRQALGVLVSVAASATQSRHQALELTLERGESLVGVEGKGVINHVVRPS